MIMCEQIRPKLPILQVQALCLYPLTAAAEAAAAPPAGEARLACESAAAAAGLQGLSCTISTSGEVPSAPFSYFPIMMHSEGVL